MAAGFIEPAVTDAYTCIYNCKNLSLWYVFLRCIFWVLYFMDTALLVRVYIPYTQKWAAGCNPPLRSGAHTMMDWFGMWYFWFNILLAQRCW